MKTKVLPVVFCGLLVAVAPCFARSTKKATPAPHHEPTITAVAGNTITVSDDKSAKTITASSVTEITVNGQKASFADLKPGMTVSLTLSSPTQARKIAATSK
jgi:hypothetical protein